MATDSAKEDMADLSLSKRTPPPPPGEDESTISAASEEAGMEAGGASGMKGNCEQGTLLLSTLQDNTKQEPEPVDERMETGPETQSSTEPLVKEEDAEQDQQQGETAEPPDDTMETESVASHEHKTTSSTDVTSNNPKRKEKELPPPPPPPPPLPARQTRGSRATPTNKRTRRGNTKSEDEAKFEEETISPATTPGNETETEDKGKGKAGKGRGRGASRQTPKIEQSSSSEEVPVKSGTRKGGGGVAHSYSAGYRVTRATAAAVGIKTVDFIQLPASSAQKKRKRGCDDTASDDTEPSMKKNKGEDEDEAEEGMSDEEPIPSTPSTVTSEKPIHEKPAPEKPVPEKVSSEKPAPKKPAVEKSMPEDTAAKLNPRARGRGRGKRGAVKSEQPESESEGVKKYKQVKDSEATPSEETEDLPMKETPTKKRRGRPKRKGKEEKETTPSHSFPNTPLQSPPLVKTEDSNNKTEGQAEMEMLTSSVTNGNQVTENAKPVETKNTVSNSAPNSASSNDDGAPAIVPSNQESSTKQDQPNNDPRATTVVSPTSIPPPVVDDGGMSISQAPPTTIPVEVSYQFPPPPPPHPSRGYPHDASGYPYPPHIHPSFIAPHHHAPYPPFPAQPYHPFMIPTSPHFPYPPPHSDVLSHPALYFPEDFVARYPPQSTAAQSSAANAPPTAPPTSATNKASSPSMESPVTTSGGSAVNHSHPSTPTVTTPVTHGMPVPHPLNYNPPHMGPPHYPIPPPPPPFNFGLPEPWNVNHQMPGPPGAPPAQAPPSIPPPPPPPQATSSAKPKDARLPVPFVQQQEETRTVVTSNPVNCPECGRHFKNNKALNGHMRLHGGFDWTKRICRPYVMGAAKKEEEADGGKEKNGKSEPEEGGASSGRGKQNHKESKPHNKPSDHTPQSKVKEKETRLPGGTLDDLCRAAEELERIERDSMKPRPSPLTLPHERRIASFSPPYTPPPILSPARSLVLLSGGGGASSGIGGGGSIPTPNKIWPQRKGSDNKGVKDLEEPFEPKINIGSDFQATIPNCVFNFEGSEAPPSHEALVWEPMSGLSQEDEDTIDGYLELACSPAVPCGGRNKELALQLLKQVNGSVKEAVRLLVMGKSLLPPEHELIDYNYTSSSYWTPKERQQFRRAWRVHRKQFNMLQSSVETKTLPEIIEYYYFWKKYCPDEYRGRNRHVSEELLSEEEEGMFCPSSTGSHSSDSNDTDQQPLDDSAHINGTLSSSKSSVWSSRSSEKGLQRGGGGGGGGGKMGGYLTESREMSRSYSSQSVGSSQSTIGPSGNQEHRCKYPGCNQVYSSIFALNGHIRIHGGSWYPKKLDVENTREESPPLHLHMSAEPKNHTSKKEEEILRKHQLEVAKTMVMELAQPRSPAHSLGNFTPSPKPSPSHGRSSLVKSKKACSASPADKEGFYPCIRCGRVFHKVKSRSAHMKSHIIKQQTNYFFRVPEFPLQSNIASKSQRNSYDY